MSAITDHPHFTIRSLWEGQADDKHISAEYEHVAERLYSSTVALFQRMNSIDGGVIVQLIEPDGETIRYERFIDESA